MALGEGFRHAERLGLVKDEPVDGPVDDVEKGFRRKIGPRRVRTLRGVKVFGQPIGTIITRDMVERARREGRLNGAGERAYGRYGAGGPAKPARSGKAPARAAQRAVAPPKVKDPVPPKTFNLAGTSRKDLKEMKEALQRATDIPVGEKNRRLRAIAAREQELQAKRDKKRPNAPARTRAREAAPKAPENDGPSREQQDREIAEWKDQKRRQEERYNSDEFKGKVADWERRIDEANDPDEIKVIEREMRRDEPDMPPKVWAAIRSRADAKRGALAGRAADARREREAEEKAQQERENQAIRDILDDHISNAISEGELKEAEDELPRLGLSPEDRRKFDRKIAYKRRELSPDAPPAQPQSGTSAFDRIGDMLRVAERSIQDWSEDDDEIGRRLDEAERELRRNGKDMSQEQREMLGRRVQNMRAVLNTTKSPTYEKHFAALEDANSVVEFAAALRAIDRDIMLTSDEQDRLTMHLVERAEAMGFDPDRLAAKGAQISLDFDSHPDKVNAPVHQPKSPVQARMLTTRRVLANFAQQARLRERFTQNPDASPAGKEISKGVDLDKVKNPEGLVEHVFAHPERFQTNRVHGGQGGAFTVLDKKTGREFFFKETLNGQPNANGQSVEMHGEAVNEVMSGKIGGAFRKWFPDVDFASSIEEGISPVIRMDHMNEHVKKHFGKDVAAIRFDSTYDEEEGWGTKDGRWGLNIMEEWTPSPNWKPVRDPANPLAIHIFDFLTNNTDRHSGNFATVEHNDGTVSLVAMDNGAAFHGFDMWASSVIPSHFITAPETVGYAEWLDTYNSGSGLGPDGRAHQMIDETFRAFKHHNRLDAKQIEKEASKILKGFAAMSPEQIRADLLRRFPNMAEYEKAHLDAAVSLLQNRIKLITPADVARAIIAQEYKG